MADIFNFPNGYPVRICRKDDIINVINDNIIDKDIALELVKDCEQAAIEFLNQGCWASIPFIGNIRTPEVMVKAKQEEIKELIADAKDELDKDKYLLFRKNVYTDLAKQVKQDRYRNYMTSKFVKANIKFYKHLCSDFGENLAIFLCSTLYEMQEAK